MDRRVIAFTGYEQDQVIVSPLGKPGENPELDTSVPINWAYNHHYAFFVTGTGAQMEEVAAQPGDDHVDWAGGGKKWVPRETTPSAGGFPTSTVFSDADGGESRKSFHGYPRGYAQLVCRRTRPW